jgi:hypothetical protein
VNHVPTHPLPSKKNQGRGNEFSVNQFLLLLCAVVSNKHCTLVLFHLLVHGIVYYLFSE